MTLTEAREAIHFAEVACPKCQFDGCSDCAYVCSVAIKANDAFDVLAEVAAEMVCDMVDAHETIIVAAPEEFVGGAV